MTAEIAIMNSTAVALAADSAVTIQAISETQVKEKIYNTTNKLFMLSKWHPVGIMLYGNATILQVPWEVVIKEYRSNLGSRGFDTIEEYTQDFIGYLGEFFPEEDQMRHLLSNVVSFYVGQVLPQIDRAVHEAIHEGGSVTEGQLERIAREVISRSKKWYTLSLRE